ncbi:hypothetical protein [Sphingosinicella terrae]|uniref:hypothetical protein n=1 Tax=Sphingosinicella terrae TaxID=2172047 RepID=UPI000E0D7EE3|nr:hypothetical protein [Sphingosinicella terrae]
MAESSAGAWVVLGLIGLAIYSCSSDPPPEATAGEYSATSSDVSEVDEEAGIAGYSTEPSGFDEVLRGSFDEDAARDAAEDEVASDTYSGIGRTYGCTDDCSGHDAGFRWRRDRGYVPYGADSQSFQEGAQAFEDAVDDRVEEMRDEYEAGENPY